MIAALAASGVNGHRTAAVNSPSFDPKNWKISAGSTPASVAMARTVARS
jgi:hypothetical protein